MPEADRTEQATQKRRKKAREEGQVARTRELSPALALLTTIMCLSWMVIRWPREWYDLFSTILMATMRGGEGVTIVVIRKTALLTFRWAALPVGLGFLVALGASFAQGGFVLAPKALSFKPEKFSPATNAKRLFSSDSIRKVLKSCVPTAILVYLATTVLASHWGNLQTLSFVPGQSVVFVATKFDVRNDVEGMPGFCGLVRCRFLAREVQLRTAVADEQARD